MDSYILLLCHVSFIIGHPSRVRPGKHFYTCAARARHEINLRGASYKLVPEYFVACWYLWQGPGEHVRLRNLIMVPMLTNIKFEVDEDSACSDQIKF